MTLARLEVLRACALRYIWWESSDEALRRPRRVIAQVMDLGTWEDVSDLLKALGEDPFQDALLHAEPGWFTARSWHYWWRRLGALGSDEQVPPIPVRPFVEAS